jgi:hypothetical protein
MLSRTGRRVAWLGGNTKWSRKSDTTTAIRYALGLWEALIRYCDDGRLAIDNNTAERAARSPDPDVETEAMDLAILPRLLCR